MTLEEIGREYREKYPRKKRTNDRSDYEIGVALLKANPQRYRPKLTSNDVLEGSHPIFFLSRRNQIREQQLNLQNLTNQLNTATLQNLFQHRHEAPEMELQFQRKSEINANDHESSMLAHQQGHEVTKARHPYTMENLRMAGELGINPFTLETLNTVHYNNEVAQNNKRRLDKIQNKQYKQEIAVDLNAALAKHIIPYEVADALKTKIFNLLRERARIAHDKTLDDYGRQIALEKQDQVISKFGESLNEQMERYLLSPADGEDIPGIR